MKRPEDFCKGCHYSKYTHTSSETRIHCKKIVEGLDCENDSFTLLLVVKTDKDKNPVYELYNFPPVDCPRI